MNKWEHRTKVFFRAGRTVDEANQETQTYRDSLDEASLDGWEFIRVETLELISDGREKCRITWRRPVRFSRFRHEHANDHSESKIPRWLIGTGVLAGLAIWAITAVFIPEPITSMAVATAFFLIGLFGIILYLNYRERKP